MNLYFGAHENKSFRANRLLLPPDLARVLESRNGDEKKLYLFSGEMYCNSESGAPGFSFNYIELYDAFALKSIEAHLRSAKEITHENVGLEVILRSSKRVTQITMNEQHEIRLPKKYIKKLSLKKRITICSWVGGMSGVSCMAIFNPNDYKKYKEWYTLAEAIADMTEDIEQEEKEQARQKKATAS